MLEFLKISVASVFCLVDVDVSVAAIGLACEVDSGVLAVKLGNEFDQSLFKLNEFTLSAVVRLCVPPPNVLEKGFFCEFGERAGKH